MGSMFSELRSRIRLWKLKRFHRRLVEAQDGAMVAFKAHTTTQAQADKKANKQWYDWEENADEIAKIETKLLLKKAYKHHIIIPPYVEGELWQKSNFDGAWYLTYEGKIQIRAKLRVEAKDRTELIRLWLPSIISTVAAVGAWIAALKK